MPDTRDLVTSFINSFAYEADLIQQHFSADDLMSLQQDAHRIGGAAKMFALDDIAHSALALELAIKNKTAFEINHLVTQLLELMHCTRLAQNSSISPS